MRNLHRNIWNEKRLISKDLNAVLIINTWSPWSATFLTETFQAVCNRPRSIIPYKEKSLNSFTSKIQAEDFLAAESVRICTVMVLVDPQNLDECIGCSDS